MIFIKMNERIKIMDIKKIISKILYRKPNPMEELLDEIREDLAEELKRTIRIGNIGRSKRYKKSRRHRRLIEFKISKRSCCFKY